MKTQGGIQQILAITLADLHAIEAAQLGRLEPLLPFLDGELIQPKIRFHIEQTKQHLNLLELILHEHQIDFGGRKNKVVLQVLAELDRIVLEVSVIEGREKLLTSSLKKLEDLEISLYKTARAFALHSGAPAIVDVLTIILRQEQAAAQIIEEYIFNDIAQLPTSFTVKSSK